MLLGAALIWGSTFVVVDAAIERVSSLLFNALRFSLALLMLLPVVVVRRVWPSREAWIAGFAVGAITGACGLLLRDRIPGSPPFPEEDAPRRQNDDSGW